MIAVQVKMTKFATHISRVKAQDERTQERHVTMDIIENQDIADAFSATKCSDIVRETVSASVKQVLGLSQEISQIREEEQAKLPFHINVIESAAVGHLHETAHSRILRDLLLHKDIQRSFLHRFLGLDLSRCKVDREKDNIDVALSDDEHFVIIENKVNDAVEQEHQVYRYVHTALESYHYKQDQIYVIYLNSTTHDEPSIQSLCDGNPETDVRKILGDRFKVKSFTEDILNWLSDLNFPNEPYLHSAIYQYIDYLNRHFELLDEYSDMKKKIEEFLAKELQLENLSTSERMKVLEESKEDVKSISDGLDLLIKKTKLIPIKENIIRLHPQFTDRLTDFENDGPQFHLLLSNGCTLAIEIVDNFYWCLCNSSYDGNRAVTEGQKEWAKSVLEPIGKVGYNTVGNFYIAWQDTNDPEKDFIDIYNSILKNTDVTLL